MPRLQISLFAPYSRQSSEKWRKLKSYHLSLFVCRFSQGPCTAYSQHLSSPGSWLDCRQCRSRTIWFRSFSYQYSVKVYSRVSHLDEWLWAAPSDTSTLTVLSNKRRLRNEIISLYSELTYFFQLHWDKVLPRTISVMPSWNLCASR